jgi:hypothetical protein
MSNSVSSFKQAYLNGAQNCHTMDRRNLKAQKDCGAGRGSGTVDMWKNAVENQFNMTFWP